MTGPPGVRTPAPADGSGGSESIVKRINDGADHNGRRPAVQVGRPPNKHHLRRAFRIQARNALNALPFCTTNLERSFQLAALDDAMAALRRLDRLGARQ